MVSNAGNKPNPEGGCKAKGDDNLCEMRYSRGAMLQAIRRDRWTGFLAAEPRPCAEPKRWAAALEATALTGFTIACTGYRFGTGMQLMLIPYARRLVDRGYLANDWLLGLVPKHYAVTWALGASSRLVNLELVFLLAHLATTILFVLALRRLARVLFGGGGVLYLSLFLLLSWGAGGLGGNVLFGDYFNPHNLGVPFCAFALASALEGRFVHGALFAAIATDVHLLLGLNTFALLVSVRLLSDRPFDRAAWIRGTLLYAAIAGPAILPVFLLARGSDVLAPAEFQRIHVWMRNPHHYAPSTWPLSEFAKFGFVVLFAAVASLRHRPAPDVHRRVLVFCGTVAVLCLVATLAVQAVPVEFVTKLQFFRMTIFVRLIAVLYVANFVARTVDEGSGVARLGALAVLATPPRLALTALAAGISLTPQDRRRRRAWLLGIGVSAAAVAFAVVVAGDRALFLTRHNRATAGGLLAAGLGTAALAALLALLRDVFPRRPQSSVAAFASLLVLAGARAATGTTFAYGLPEPGTSRWVEVCRWVRDHTPHDAVFIAPPYRGDFRLLAERAEIVDFKGNTFWENAIVEWKKRLEDLANTRDLDCSGIDECRRALRTGYRSLREPDFERLACRYGAAYVVTDAELPSFPRLHANGRWAVYGVPGRFSSEGPRRALRTTYPQACIAQTAKHRAVNATATLAVRRSSDW